ncbi:MAG: uracil-DNA glycosylase, partial [Kordiimonas sp.]
TTLEELEAALKAFDGGLLKRSAKNTVFADGTQDAPIMVIGDVPGSEEDQSGKPFAGPAGKLLDKMLAAIDCNRAENVYLSDFVPWRLLGNAKPTPDVLAMCKPFVERHIALAKPKIVVLMGGIPARTLFNTEDSISRLRGKWKKLSIDGTDFDVLPMTHPSYLMSQPLQKRAAWQDLLAIREKLLS